MFYAISLMAAARAINFASSFGADKAALDAPEVVLTNFHYQLQVNT
jgi:hypothetical protein